MFPLINNICSDVPLKCYRFVNLCNVHANYPCSEPPGRSGTCESWHASLERLSGDCLVVSMWFGASWFLNFRDDMGYLHTCKQLICSKPRITVYHLLRLTFLRLTIFCGWTSPCQPQAAAQVLQEVQWFDVQVVTKPERIQHRVLNLDPTNLQNAHHFHVSYNIKEIVTYPIFRWIWKGGGTSLMVNCSSCPFLATGRDLNFRISGTPSELRHWPAWNLGSSVSLIGVLFQLLWSKFILNVMLMLISIYVVWFKLFL